MEQGNPNNYQTRADESNYIYKLVGKGECKKQKL